MKKIIGPIQLIFGIIAFLSFFAVFISIFINKDYSGLFFGLFFSLLPITLFLNKFTKNWRFSIGYIILLIALFSIGLIGFYSAIKTFQTHTVYTLYLEGKGGDLFEGGFNVPADVVLKDKKHTFYIGLNYTLSKNIIGRNELVVDFSNPQGFYKGTLRLDTKKAITSITSRVPYNFQGVPGTYFFKIYPKENLDIHFQINLIKVIIREYK